MALTKIKTGGIADNAITDAKVADNITAGTAATLATARNINGVSFNGSSAITVTSAAGTLTGNTLASGVTASSLTSVGTLTGLTSSSAITLGTQSSGLNAFNVNRARFQSHENNNADMSVNLAFNGSAWVNDNDSQDSQLLRLYSGQGLTYYVSSAQATPNLVSKFSVDTSGNATFAGNIVGKTNSSITYSAGADTDTVTGGAFRAPGSDIVTGRLFFQGGSNGGGNLAGINNESDKLVIYDYHDGSYMMKLDYDGNATFTGDVTVDGDRYMLTESGTNKGFFGKDDWATSGGSANDVNVGSYSGTVKLTAGAGTNSTPNITCNTDKTVTTAGDFQPGADIQLQNGRGISFANMPNESGMTSELLDDYEEGTYTITITGSGGGSWVMRSGYTKGSYTKIGRLVTVTARYETSSKSGESGDLRFNLPFTCADLTDQAGGSVGSITLNRSAYTITDQISPVTFDNVAYFMVQRHENGQSETYMQASDIDGTFEGHFTLTYVSA